MEDFVLVFSYFLFRDCDSFSVVISNDIWCLSNVGDNLRVLILLNLIDDLFYFICHFVWDLNLCFVWDLMFNDIGYIDRDLVWLLVINCHWDLLLNLINFLFVLCHFNLASDDVWDFLPYRVINSFCGLIGHLGVLLVRYLIDDSVWHWCGYNIWYLVSNSVGHLLGDCVWDLYLDLIRYLPLNGIRDLLFDFIRHLNFNFVWFLHNLSDCNLVRHLISDSDWDLFSNLVLFCNVVGDNKVLCII